MISDNNQNDKHVMYRKEASLTQPVSMKRKIKPSHIILSVQTCTGINTKMQ